MGRNEFDAQDTNLAVAWMELRASSEKRECRLCGSEKLLGEFGGRIIKHDGRLQVSFRSTCKQCSGPRNSARVKLARQKDDTYSRACAYWNRSRSGGIPSNLKLADIRLLLSCPCYYCRSASSEMTLDRRNPVGGYTKDNVVPCCYRCSSMKSDMPEEAWLHILPAVHSAAKLGKFGKWRAEIPSRTAKRSREGHLPGQAHS